MTGSKEDFLSVLQTLAQAGRRVLAIDMRGQYETPGGGEPEDYTCEALGADIAALVATLGPEPVHLVGHSFGGLVAREAVLAGALPQSLTLMSSGPSAITGRRAGDAYALLSALPMLGLQRLWTVHMEPQAQARGLSEEIFTFLRDRMLSNCPTGLAGMAEAILRCPDRVEELAKVGAETALPMLVLYGEDDDAWSPHVQADMAERLDAARVVIPGAAHSPAVEAPETTASALNQFWALAELGRR